MNKLHMSFLVFSCLIHTTAFGMDNPAPVASTGEGVFVKYEVSIPLKLNDANAPIIKKDIFLDVADLVGKAKTPVSEVAGIPADIGKSVMATVLTVQKSQHVDQMQTAVATCVGLLFNNDKGWHFPHLEASMQHVNPELLALIKRQQTYFLFFPQQKALVLRWDLGEYEDGWAFDKLIQVTCKADHPRKGVCSDIMIKYYNTKKNVVGEIPLHVLRELYSKDGKKTLLQPALMQFMSKAEADELQKKDVIAMTRYYLSQKK